MIRFMPKIHIQARFVMLCSPLLQVHLLAYADNVALPAFARGCCSNRSLSPARQSTAANLQQRVCLCGTILGQTGGQTDGHRTVS